ncbi:hypothetical protein LBMAG44_02330 [Gemmatimonadota bacterium]|nr:hypothetical protein LBMAG44_02330 [Gemmatimonadota bacterium]
MIGDVAAALDIEQLDAAEGECVTVHEQMTVLGAASGGDDRWMLDEDQEVLVEAAINPGACRRALQLKGIGVPDTPEIGNEKAAVRGHNVE